jgi:putative phosphoesterase
MPERSIPRRIGVISDTHGHLEAAAVKALQGVDLILHAGDIDTFEVLRQLELIAPVVAVQGNMDRGVWSHGLNQTELVTLGKTWIYMMHDYGHLDLDPQSANITMIIHGHTHRAEIKTHQGVTYLNPGSASSPRGGGNPTLALIELDSDGGNPEITWIEI